MRSEAESAGLPVEDPSKEGASGEGGSETKPGGPGPEEKEIIPPKADVWIVDDDASLINAFLRNLEYDVGEGFQFSHYQEGEQAVADFSNIIEAKGLMPALILMDYKLDVQVDDPKYRTGVEVIEELKKIAAEYKIPLPEIAAFSSEKSYAELLMQAGASATLNKMNYIAVVKHIKEMAEGADRK